LSNKVSAVPSANATTAMRTSVSLSVRTSTASAVMASIRNASTIAIVRRRSSRSASAPPRSANSSQGSVPAREIAAMLVGERVSVAARRGRAASVTPSPRFDTVAALQSRT
jgi:hypothetical protein